MELNEFKVLNASIPDDQREWLRVWSSWEGREVGAHPEYVGLFCQAGEKAMCSVYRGRQGLVIFPMVLRPLAEQPWGKRFAGMYDITTAYGYGGPFALEGAEGDAFWENYNGWASETGVVSTFARLSLFPEDLIPLEGREEAIAENVVRDLAKDEEVIWMDYEHKVRKNVKKALRSGLEVITDSEGRFLSEFLDIYYTTMERREARCEYRFPRSFFERIIALLPGSYVFFLVRGGGEFIAAELVLLSGFYAYSFLGGTKAEFFELRPNDLLKDFAFRWAKAHGKRAFVLGGGYQRDDGILRYKLSFSPKGIRPFRVLKIIQNAEAYQELLQARREWEKENGRSWEPSPGFFPEYRS